MIVRVGFAGKRDPFPKPKDDRKPSPEEIANHSKMLEGSIQAVLAWIGQHLVKLAPRPPSGIEGSQTIPHFYAARPPLLRLITGLCEGADTLAYQTLEKLSMDGLEVENALVIGFGLDAYRNSRDPGFRTEFDRQLTGAAYLLEADGVYLAGDSGKTQRNRAYRCQADLMLRQSDLLLALVDPQADIKPGGTMETVLKALQFDLPVVLIEPVNGKIFVVGPSDHLPKRLENPGDPDWSQRLENWLVKLVADPLQPARDHQATHGPGTANANVDEKAAHGASLLEEFFSGTLPLPDTSCDWLTWDAFRKWFAPKKPPSARGTTPPPPPTPVAQAYDSADAFLRYRERASKLSALYATLYRDTFYRNALFALFAVLLAAGSLLLLVLYQGKPDIPGIITLIALATLKFGLVRNIYRSASKAHHLNYNYKAVDYRYLSERLRAMLYLPATGIWQPPATASPQYESRVIRQSAVDWLHDAIVRHVSPGAWAGSAGVIHLEPVDALKTVTDRWLVEQLGYHRKTATELQRMNRWLRSAGELLNFAVLAIVAFDIVLLALKGFDLLSPAWKAVTPGIIFITAVFPAAVAAVNLIRLQSESERLAERSAVMVRLLGGRDAAQDAPPITHGQPGDEPSGFGTSHDKMMRFFGEVMEKLRILRDPAYEARPKTPATQEKLEGGKIQEAGELLTHLASPDEQALGSHAGSVLHFTETCAELFVQEVAEWSVLYAKELVEP